MDLINQQRLISTFTDLASISSPSWHEHDLIDYIEKRLSKLNIQMKKIPCGESFIVLAELKGDESRPPILLSGHMDTVNPCTDVKPIVGEKKITSDGTTVLGSDDKSAIAQFLEAFEVIAENGIQHGPVEMLLSCAEEVGLCGAKAFDTSQLKSKIGFVFDGSGSVGEMTVKAPYQYTMELHITGKAAHAGMEPEKGISAIAALAEIITKIPNGRVDEETTINVGIISGGSVTNIVAPEAYCKLEMRSISRSKIKALETEVKATAREVAKSFKAKIKIDREEEYPGFMLKETEPVVALADRAMRAAKITPRPAASGGGSDTNIYNRPGSGLRMINLSSGMQNVHTTSEYIKISDLVKGARLVLALIDEAR